MIPSPKVEAVAGVDDLALALLATLAAFGISFTAAGGIDEVGPWVVDQFEDYLDSVGESVSSVLTQLRYGVDKAGNLIGNTYALSFNARFAQWLQDEYSLVDNSSISVSDVVIPSSFVNVPFYSGTDRPGVLSNGLLYYVSHGSNNVFNPWFITTSYSSSPVYLAVISEPSGKISNAIFFSLSPTSLNPVFTRVGSYYNTSWTGSFLLTSSYGPFFYYNQSFNPQGVDYISGGSSYTSFPVFYSEDDFWAALDSAVQSLVVVNTGSIDIPQVGDYTDEDGILIDGLGSWGDSLQDIWDKVAGLSFPDVSWPTLTWGAELADQLVDSLVSVGVITTENSPGFYNGLPLVGGIPDIQFGNLWYYVTDWVNSMSGGLVLIGGIMFSLPFVAAFYALVVILLVLSLWRLLRSA